MIAAGLGAVVGEDAAPADVAVGAGTGVVSDGVGVGSGGGDGSPGQPPSVATLPVAPRAFETTDTAYAVEIAFLLIRLFPAVGEDDR